MIYDLIASIYHNENRDLDYEKWADFFEKMFSSHSKRALSLSWILAAEREK